MLILTQTADSADSNVTLAVGNHYIADISGFTANRNRTLPTPTRAGEVIEYTMVTGDDTYAAIFIGTTGVSINGGTAATEWSRLFISGERVRFESTSTSNWQVVMDGRKPCSATATLSANVTTNTAGVYKRIDLDTVEGNFGNCYNTTTYRFTVRRAGDVLVNAAYTPATAITDQNYAVCSIAKNGTVLRPHGMRNASTTTLIGTVPGAIFRSLAVGDYLDVQFVTEEANRGAQASSGNGKGCWADYQEQLR